MSRTIALTSSGVLLALALPATAATAAPGNACDNRSNNTYEKLLQCVTLEGVREHMEAFQKIADNSNDPVYPNSRAAGTEGYAESVEYVAGLLRDAGYEVTLDPVPITFFHPSELTQLTPTEAEHPNAIATGSGFGTVEGPVIPVDVNLTGDRANSSACEASDFAGLDFSGSSDIALVQRGTCSFQVKAENAEASGAEAVVIMNQGDAAGPGDRFGVVNPTLGAYQAAGPVVGTSFDAGQALAQAGSTALIEVLEPEARTDYNVIAELPGENTDNVVMAGAHLDSVTAGPGINDNGSGSAALLETALLMAKSHTPNTLRFAWWAAEEEGLVGSTAYVNGLSPAELERIALYMNYDMVGSPNYFLGVYDADESTFPATVVVPEGSEAIEDVYESYYTKVGRPYDDSEFSGRSDYQAFIENGIPSGGLFTGAEVRKTEEQREIWGGTTGEQFDPCYHEDCDTIENYDPEALEVNSDLIAFAMLHFGYSTEAVNSVPGEKVPGRAFDLPAPAGPEGTFAGGGGGLAHGHDHDHEGDDA
ncbi:PA domain-containing protein [Blastococcus colisei]|uniref:PA domain-containing protein n=1 Tax=Blastococcus colisei TaxID=1564162 RepID=A0A543PEE3_9ACTN|nr:M28 family peptidase [Blastococcus colisei]TQN42420.1 PA domain-containing protein [Blastococcus colisei]